MRARHRQWFSIALARGAAIAAVSVLFVGDSIVNGNAGLTGGARSRMRTAVVWNGTQTDAVGLKHGGVPGNTLDPQMVARVASELAASPGVREVWISGATNDAVAGATAAQCRDHLLTLIAAFRAAGFTGVIRVHSPPPWNDAAGATTTLDSYWRNYIQQAVDGRRALGEPTYYHHTFGRITQAGLDGLVSEHPIDSAYGADGYGLAAEWIDKYLNPSAHALDPTTLPNSRVWLPESWNASTGWAEVTGSGHTQTATGATKPTVGTNEAGEPCLVFANSPVRSTGWTNSGQGTVWIVLGEMSSSGQPAIFDGGDTTHRHSMQVLTAGGLSPYAGNSSADLEINALTRTRLYAFEFNGVTSKMYVDGAVRRANFAWGTQVMAGVTVGGSSAPSPTNVLASGKVSAFGIVDRYLTESEHFGLAAWVSSVRGNNLWPKLGETAPY